MGMNIIGWGVQYGPCNYTNEELCEIFGLPERKAKEYGEMLGVEERQMAIDHRNGHVQIVRDDQLAADAAKKAIEVAGLEVEDIDVIISTYTSMDYITPGVAERVQSNLKIIEGHAINLVGGCAELINGIVLAKLLIEHGGKKNILLTTSDIANPYYKNFTYPFEFFITGDSAGAIVLSEKESPFSVAHSNFKTIGRMQNLMPIPLWGIKEPCPLIVENTEVHPLLEKMTDIDKKYRWRRKEVMMSTTKIFVNNLGRITNELLSEVGGTLEETYIILPQFNRVMMEKSAELFNMSLDDVPQISKHHGCEGTSAPIATFAEAYTMLNKFEKYKYIVMPALGINGSYGGTLIEVK